MSSRLALILLFGLLGACASTPSSQTPAPPLSNPLTKAPSRSSSDVLHKVALGSCNRQDLPQPMWRKIQDEKPELFVWLGDIIYADTHDMTQLTRLYQFQLQQPEYASFLSSVPAVIGTYDDHDYGTNNSGTEYPERKMSQSIFLDFIGEPKDSPRRQQEGIYQSYTFGPEGKRVKFLVLDTRYHREKPGKGADILGAAQWTWLQKELAQNDAELAFLVSSIQVLPSEHDFETWERFPTSRQRLLDLIAASPIPNIAILSGDRHIAEISKLALPSGREVYELTSSGLTHSYGDAYTEKRNKNSLRIGPVMTRLNYGWLMFDWEAKDPSFTLEARNINKQSVLSAKIPLKR